MLNNQDFNIDQNNRDYHFVHNGAVLVCYMLVFLPELSAGTVCVDGGVDVVPFHQLLTFPPTPEDVHVRLILLPAPLSKALAVHQHRVSPGVSAAIHRPGDGANPEDFLPPRGTIKGLRCKRFFHVLCHLLIRARI